MVVLILTRSGFDDLRPRFAVARDAAWVNAGVLADAEVDALRAVGWNLTTFANPLNPHDMASDIETVRLHHPDQVVWDE